MAGFLKDFFKPKRPSTSNEAATQAAAKEPPKERVEPDPDAVRNATTTGELEELAIHGVTAGQRREAIDRIDDIESLGRIARALKGRDKGAFQAARQKLRHFQETEEKARQRQAEIERVIADTEAHSRTQDTKLYQARMDALASRWEAVRTDASEDQAGRFHAVMTTSRQRAESLVREEAEVTRLQHQRDEQQATIDTLEATLTQLRAGYPEEGASLSSLDAMTKTQITRWEQATTDLEPDEKLAATYHERISEIQHYQNALAEWQKHEEALNLALANDDEAALQELVTWINWPTNFPGPPPLVQAERRVATPRAMPESKSKQTDQDGDNKASQAREEELRTTLDQLEATLEQHQLKPSRQHFRHAQKLQDQLPGRQARQHQARITRLGRQLQELRDWLGFAARPKLETLCEQMEYLADQPMEPETKAEHIRELQHNWHDLGGTPDQELWQRFKEATDRAYEPCHEYFAEKNRLKSANLAKREHIVEQLQEFVDNLDWSSCDYKAVDRIQRTARREWSDAKPVDFRANRPLQKQFDRLIKTLNAGLDQERERNEALKQDIVARAEAFIDHEPLREATEGAKALQKEWEAIGITHHSEDRKLWKAFRAACDRIFARLSEEREAEQQSRNAAAEEADRLIRQLEALSPESVDDGEIRGIQEAFSALELPRDRVNALRDRFHKALDHLDSRRQEVIRSQRYEQWLDALNAHEKDEAVPPGSFGALAESPETMTQETEVADQGRALCIRVEIATGAATPPEDQAQRMALQVNRLNEGIKGDQSAESQWDEIEGLLATWCELDPNGGIEARHYERLREALKHWFYQSTH
ncbi:uncharacterized protein DUF349 [Halospina denitrificans]|uniref:Uncharacterized protein DUF349 n=1 Tax=Halospina denitrificans TaxID=332522 RepID=A0A4R7JND3_9GAMM|nr:DUF349 domain-containing protein [Halospina denitrificans]TDT38643.1 uncharacterized protein DUF349 [Halospina denitrificans]